MLTVTQTDEGVQFAIHVVPRSSKSEVAGIRGGALKIRITAPPVEDRANEACVRFLAALFNVKRTQVSIAGGQKSRNKRIAVAGLTAEDIRAAISRPGR